MIWLWIFGILLFFVHKWTKVWVTQPKVMSALEEKKDMRASLKEKRGLGSPLLGLG